MINLKAFWGRVKEIRETLPPEVFITSIENKSTGLAGGATCAAFRNLAAELIAKGSHRVATQDEVSAFHAEQKKQSEAFAKETYESRQHFAMPTEIAKLIEIAAVNLTKTKGKE